MSDQPTNGHPSPAPSRPGSDLFPCPFCGSREVDATYEALDANPVDGPIIWFVECGACGSQGPQSPGNSEAEAVAAWNRRTDG